MAFDLTPPQDGDLDAIVELYRACDAVDAPGTVSDREDVAWRWRTSGFDRGRDAWLARRGDAIAGTRGCSRAWPT